MKCFRSMQHQFAVKSWKETSWTWKSFVFLLLQLRIHSNWRKIFQRKCFLSFAALRHFLDNFRENHFFLRNSQLKAERPESRSESKAWKLTFETKVEGNWDKLAFKSNSNWQIELEMASKQTKFRLQIESDFNLICFQRQIGVCDCLM